MTQTEIIDKLNSIYPGLNLVEINDPYSSYDAENKKYIVEVKSRDKKYDKWIIEKKKFDNNIVKSIEKAKTFVYLTEHNKKIMTWNIHNLVRKGYNFSWDLLPMPVTTEFDNQKIIAKQVGYLYERDARVHT